MKDRKYISGSVATQNRTGGDLCERAAVPPRMGAIAEKQGVQCRISRSSFCGLGCFAVSRCGSRVLPGLEQRVAGSLQCLEDFCFI